MTFWSLPFANPPLLLATAEFYATSASTEALIHEIRSIAESGSDFEHNPLALRKRLYFIMVELACIHEQFRSTLIRRQQIVEEGYHIRDRLQELAYSAGPISGGSGIDSIVP